MQTYDLGQTAQLIEAMRGTRMLAPVLLAVLSGLGVAFSGYLTYLEAAVLHAWCRWCLVSAGLILAIFVTSLAGLRSVRRRAGES